MIIAQEKKKTNIAEYILYMWKVEDLIRTYNLNISLIEKNIISQYKVNNQQYEEIKIWYQDLIGKMKNENIEKRGHLKFINILISEIYQLHVNLLASPNEKKYKEIYKKAKSNINNLRIKSEKKFNDIEICLIGLYGLLMLRLEKRQILEETKQAMNTFSNLMALLSLKYRDRGK